MTSRREMLLWARGQLGRALDVDGAYGAQCVDLIMAYAEQFGGFRTHGNAIDYLKNALPPGWVRYRKGEAALEEGDVAIWQWGANDEFGHVGIVLNIEGDKIFSVEQNVDGTPLLGGPGRLMARDDAYLVGFIRPRYDDSECWERIEKKGRFVVGVEAINVRSAPDRSSEVVAVYHEGESFYYDSYVCRDGHVWASYIASQSGRRRYVATGTFQEGKQTSFWGLGSDKIVD